MKSYNRSHKLRKTEGSPVRFRTLRPAVDTLKTLRWYSRIFWSFPIKRLCLP